MNYITSVVEVVRVPNVNEVEKLHKELKEDRRFELKKFEYTHKEIKQKGEIIDEYELVKATLLFNNEKEPECFVKIDFDVDNGFFPDPIEKEDDK
jgi:hypothetical protein